MSRSAIALTIALVLSLVVLGYFAVMAWRPRPLARVLLRRGYEQQGWDEARLARRVRVLGVAGSAVALAAILLAAVRFVG